MKVFKCNSWEQNWKEYLQKSMEEYMKGYLWYYEKSYLQEVSKTNSLKEYLEKENIEGKMKEII